MSYTSPADFCVVQHGPNMVQPNALPDPGVTEYRASTIWGGDAVATDTLEVGGHRIAYRGKGEGPPLVLLHGWPLTSREWRHQFEGLSDEFTVVAWDAPVAGASSDPPEAFRLP
jgi:hypothetical protein